MTSWACEHCGQPFVPRRSDQRFHNERCRMVAKDRKRGWAALGSEVTLHCRRCSANFTRPAATGRRPHLCPECRK
jgi:DNA-directed RNA polymerase subunit RPC12/RpoP